MSPACLNVANGRQDTSAERQSTASVMENVMPRKQATIICDAERTPALKDGARIVTTRRGWLPRWLRFFGF
jgi:hypothetical protein